MTRSRRRNPIIPWSTAASDKPFKVDEHRSERRNVRTALASGIDLDDKRMNSKTYGDPGLAPKDGKQFTDPKSKWMRK